MFPVPVLIGIGLYVLELGRVIEVRKISVKP